MKNISKTTQGGIKRPVKGDFVRFVSARSHAKNMNVAKGRGFRALKATDGSYGVVFRPAVANNKQRRVREVI